MPSLPPREVIAAIDLLVAKAGMVAVICIDQLDGLIAITRQDSEDAPAEALLLDQIANGLMDLAQDSHNSLIALSCLRPTWERIKSKTLESAPYRYPTVLQFRPIPSSEVGEALIAAYFDRAYERVGFRPPYPTWPIKPTAFQDAQDYTPRQLIELSEAHVRKCRQTGAITELDDFPGADNLPSRRASRAVAEPIELSLFASLDADFAAARKAAEIEGPSMRLMSMRSFLLYCKPDFPPGSTRTIFPAPFPSMGCHAAILRFMHGCAKCSISI